MKRIEAYSTFLESEEATLLMYLSMTPEERWVKGHELSDGVKSHVSSSVYNLFLSSNGENHNSKSHESD
jgi:hypothetical protein